MKDYLVLGLLLGFSIFTFTNELFDIPQRFGISLIVILIFIYYIDNYLNQQWKKPFKNLTFIKLVNLKVLFHYILLLPMLLLGVELISEDNLSESREYANSVLEFLDIVVLGPIFEEFNFRFLLTFQKLFFFNVLFYLYDIFLSYKIFPLFAFIGVLIAKIIFKISNQTILVILSSFAFSIAHISNYQETLSLSAILIAIPFFINGIIYALVRIKYGLFYSILLHIFSNGFLFSITEII